jgi:hypothetical protein
LTHTLATWAPYDQLSGLEHLYLEDSYLLGIHEDDDELRFDV